MTKLEWYVLHPEFFSQDSLFSSNTHFGFLDHVNFFFTKNDNSFLKFSYILNLAPVYNLLKYFSCIHLYYHVNSQKKKIRIIHFLVKVKPLNTINYSIKQYGMKTIHNLKAHLSIYLY